MNKLEFKEDTHEYKIGKKKLISVTQLLDKYTEDFDTDAIIDKMFEKSADKEIYIGPKRDIIGMTKEQIKTQWDINRISKSAYGTYIHNWAEYYGNVLIGNELEIQSIEPDLPEKKQVVKFFKTEVYEIVSQELRIYSEELGTAGTVDLLLKDKDGKYCILDWKTNCGKDLSQREVQFNKYFKEPIDNVPDTPFWHYALQMSIYRYMMEYEGDYKPEELGDMYIVHLIGSKDDLKDKYGRHVIYPEMSKITYKMIKVPYMRNEVIKILEDLKNG